MRIAIPFLCRHKIVFLPWRDSLFLNTTSRTIGICTDHVSLKLKRLMNYFLTAIRWISPRYLKQLVEISTLRMPSHSIVSKHISKFVNFVFNFSCSTLFTSSHFFNSSRNSCLMLSSMELEMEELLSSNLASTLCSWQSNVGNN